MAPARCRFPAASVIPSRRTPEHAGNLFLGHDQIKGGNPVERQQQPAAQPLLDGVMPVTGHRLGNLRHQRLGVAQQQALHEACLGEFLLQQPALQPVRVARRLHDG